MDDIWTIQYMDDADDMDGHSLKHGDGKNENRAQCLRL